MSNVKTAISLNEALLQKVDMVAQEMELPRSRLFVLAVEEFLQRLENQRLVDAINEVHGEFRDPNEESNMAAMRRKQRALVKGTW
jgi:metal-responsive CopG/Arc/MetJ family transcriptional regulator